MVSRLARKLHVCNFFDQDVGKETLILSSFELVFILPRLWVNIHLKWRMKITPVLVVGMGLELAVQERVTLYRKDPWPMGNNHDISRGDFSAGIPRG